MKQSLIIIILALAALTGVAQKRYVNVVGFAVTGNVNTRTTFLSGAIPPDMNSYYTTYEKTFGDVLNMLAERGFVVEQMCATAPTDQPANTVEFVIMSTTSPDAQSPIERIAADPADVTEVARYNLQGQPVTPNDKGLQIIVYSNYTTRTLLVE